MRPARSLAIEPAAVVCGLMVAAALAWRDQAKLRGGGSLGAHPSLATSALPYRSRLAALRRLLYRWRGVGGRGPLLDCQLLHDAVPQYVSVRHQQDDQNRHDNPSNRGEVPKHSTDSG